MASPVFTQCCSAVLTYLMNVHTHNNSPMYDTQGRIEIKDVRMSLQECIDFTHYARIQLPHNPLTLLWNRKDLDSLDTFEYFVHLMQRTNTLEKIDSKRTQKWQRMRWLGSTTNPMDKNVSNL